MENEIAALNLKLDTILKMLKVVMNTNNNIEVDIRQMKRNIEKITKDVKELEK